MAGSKFVFPVSRLRRKIKTRKTATGRIREKDRRMKLEEIGSTENRVQLWKLGKGRNYGVLLSEVEIEREEINKTSLEWIFGLLAEGFRLH